MVRLEVNKWAVVEIDYTEGMTADDLQQAFQDHLPGKHLRLNSWELWDTTQNRKLTGTDEIVDDRIYAAHVWVQSVVDDQGEPIKTGLV
jgi:hypothetical protein